MSGCHGNGNDHCCWIGGEVCQHLEENTIPERRWSCGLYNQFGSWEDVHSSSVYESVREKLRDSGIQQDCGNWPQELLEQGKSVGSWACCYGPNNPPIEDR